MPWVLFRMSGTEPLLRVYAEAESPELVPTFSPSRRLLSRPARQGRTAQAARKTRKTLITIGLPGLAFRFRRYDNRSGTNGFSSRYRPGPDRLA